MGSLSRCRSEHSFCWYCRGADFKFLSSVLKNSIVISPRQIACVASHPSIIPIRAEWMMRGTPILMLIRRFCSQGRCRSPRYEEDKLTTSARLPQLILQSDSEYLCLGGASSDQECPRSRLGKVVMVLNSTCHRGGSLHRFLGNIPTLRFNLELDRWHERRILRPSCRGGVRRFRFALAT